MDDPATGLTTYTYEPTGELATCIDATGAVTECATTARPAAADRQPGRHRDRDRLRQRRPGHVVDHELDREHIVRYDDAGRLVAIEGPGGHTITSDYDDPSRLVGSSDLGGAVTTRSLSPGGRVITSTSPAGVTTTYTYNDAGRVTSARDKLGTPHVDHVRRAGRVLTQRDPRQQGVGSPTVTTPTTARQPRDHRGALGNTVRSATTRWTADLGHRPAGQGLAHGVRRPRRGPEETDPNGHARTTTYDDAGRVATRTDARGVVVDHDYDAAGRLASVSERDGSGSIAYTYDDLGRRSTMTDVSGTTTWTYTDDGEVASVASPAGTVSYAYDEAGLRSADPAAGRHDLQLRRRGPPRQVTDWRADVREHVRRRRPALELTRPNGVLSR